MSEFSVSFVTEADKNDWLDLFSGYAKFYNTAIDEAVTERVWAWLLDPAHVLEGLIARGEDGQAVGIAHLRDCPRPLGGCSIGFVDDMFIDPEARGSGASDAMVERIKELARTRGWPSVRWITQHFNQRGRAFYDRYTGGPSDFIVYQLAIESGSGPQAGKELAESED